jgi:pimeloyl-ACP methyl ester carboxylesterase
VFALTGCIPLPQIAQDGVVEPAAGIADDLVPYYEQTVQWRPDCEVPDFDCATITAPLDWDDPAAGDIELAMVRYEGGSGAQGSLFTNPGGPGASGIDYVQNGAQQIFSEEILRDYDIVGWDPRGVNRSTPIECFTDAELDTYLFEIEASIAPVGTPEYDAEVEAYYSQIGQQCLQRSGPILEHVDTLSTVRDLDLMRALVGEAELDYFGFSYGTLIGSQYADMFPERVGRMVLDGVVDPGVSSLERIVFQRGGSEQSLRAYVTDCLASTGCPFTGTLDETLAEISELFVELAAEPLPGDDGRQFYDFTLSTAITAALYDEASWVVLTQMFTELEVDETSTGFLLADFYYGREPDGRYTTNMFEAFPVINCLDYPVETDPAELEQFYTDVKAAAPTTTVTLEVTGTSNDPFCQFFPFPSRGELESVDAEGAAPILVLAATGDPATPYSEALGLVEEMGSATLVSFEGDDHIAYNNGDSCVRDTVDAYLLEGTVPPSDPQCNF